MDLFSFTQFLFNLLLDYNLSKSGSHSTRSLNGNCSPAYSIVYPTPATSGKAFRLFLAIIVPQSSRIIILMPSLAPGSSTVNECVPFRQITVCV